MEPVRSIKERNWPVVFGYALVPAAYFWHRPKSG
jgi:hypothetical protein